jgi:hypothetical protein
MLKTARGFTSARRNDRRGRSIAEMTANHADGSSSPVHQPDSTDHDRREPPIPFEVERATVLDLVRIARFDRVVHLDQPERMLERALRVPEAFEAALRWSATRPVRLVARGGSRLAGFATYTTVQPDGRWQLTELGASDSQSEPDEAWLAILDQGTREAGASGVKRLYSRAPAETIFETVLHRAGYTAYAEETLFAAVDPKVVTNSIEMREQDRSDTWAIHQLYSSAVPKEVLYAEAFTSHRWELPGNRLRLGVRSRAWIHEQNFAPVAYVQCQSAGGRVVLDFLFTPDHSAELAGLLDGVLGRIRQETRGRVQVFCAVRSYEQEIERVLVERGFEPWLSQRLMVRYTTAPIRVMTAETVLSEKEALERARRRVPAYLSGSDQHR